MAHLRYFTYEGVGQQMLKTHKYNTAVRVGDTIQISGQGPWDRSTFAISNDHAEQIAQACSNVDFVLRDAGGAGWSQVFRVNSYHVPLTHEAMELMAAQFEKWMPNHKPIWTCIGSPRLGDEKMRIEIEVVAHVG